jgi:hypothetical protein
MDSTSPTPAARPCFVLRLCAELKRLAIVVILGGLAIIAGKYYGFDRLDEEIRGRVESQLREHYVGLSVSVRSARRIAGQGVEIRGIRIAEAGGAAAAVLVEIDEVFAHCDTRLPDFLTKPTQVTALHLHRLKLRAERKPNGFWTASHLLPLPPSQCYPPPSATISDASLEIVDPTQQPACSLMLRNIELTVRPQASGRRELPDNLGGALARDDDREADASRSPVTATNTVLQVQGTLAGDHVDRVKITGLLDPNTGAWELQGDIEGLEFSPRLRAALPRELSAAVAPLASIRGRTVLGFRVEQKVNLASGVRKHPDGHDAGKPMEQYRKANTSRSPLTFLLHGKISEGRIDDARLPEPLTDVEAKIRCDNHGVRIEDLSARCGRAQLELSASLAGYDGTQPIEIELAARQVQLERLPTGPLPAAVRETFARFQPRGLADISGRLRFDGHAWQPDLSIECHDLSLVYDRFPYRLADGSGTIVVKPDFLSVRLRTIGGGQIIGCRADVRNPGRNFTGWIEVQSDGPIPIDDKLIAALDLPTQRIVRSFRPRGSVTFQARLHREAGEPALHRHVTVRLEGCTVQHDKFPYPIDNVSGSLELTDDTWLFRNLTGRNDSADIAGHGAWTANERGEKQLALQFTARDVPLADELRQALPPGPQRLWSNLRPRGYIDHLVVGLSYAAATKKWSIDVAGEKWQPVAGAEGRTISLEPAWFPYALDNLTGGFRYRDGQMQLTRLQAVHGPSSLSAEGTCEVLPEGGCRLELTRLTADRVAVDAALLAALPAGLGQALARYPIEGPLNLHGSLGLTVPPQPEAAPRLAWNLDLDIDNGRVLTPTPVEHLFGGLRLVGRTTAEGPFSRGELRVDSAMIRGVQLTNVQGPFWLDGKQLVCGALADREAQAGPPRQVTAQVFDGLLSLDGQLSLDANGAFDVQATLNNAELPAIAQQLAPHQRGLTGKVFGLTHIAGNAQGKHTWRGDGQVRLRDADIYELPAMIRLLSVLSIKRPEKSAFTTSDIDFRIEGDDLVFERIDFSGDALTLKGKGRMNDQRQIDLKFYPIVGREEWHLPLFRPLLGETGREFMLIEASGTLDRPEITRKVFPRIDEQLQQLFPELVRDAPVEPTVPVISVPGISAPREALKNMRLLPRR